MPVHSVSKTRALVSRASTSCFLARGGKERTWMAGTSRDKPGHDVESMLNDRNLLVVSPRFAIGRKKMKFLLGFVTALIVLAIGAVVVAYSGVYNVAAGAPEPGILQWFLSTTMHHSVKSHAQEITAPVDLNDQKAREGFRIYRDACVYCHGAPQ